MPPKKLLAMSNDETEKRAISYVIAYERAAGRTATDARHIPAARSTSRAWTTRWGSSG
jgi:hypothetical protein